MMSKSIIILIRMSNEFDLLLAFILELKEYNTYLFNILNIVCFL